MEARSQLRHRPTKEGTSFILLEDASSVKRFPCGNHPCTVVIRRMNVPIPPIRTCCIDLTHRWRLWGCPSPDPSPCPPAPPASGGFVLANLRPALANVQTTIGSLNVAHWKASGATRSAVQEDIASMQRDLNGTLPALMAQAEANPASLSPVFAVFRNLDALYDVLLRVTETASLAGSGSDAGSLEDARAGLEDGRAKMGTWLLQSIGAQDAQIARMQAPAPKPAGAPPPPNKIVVDDGPENPKPHKKKPARAAGTPTDPRTTVTPLVRSHLSPRRCLR